MLSDLKKELMLILLKLFQEIERERRLPNLFYEAGITLTTKPDEHTSKRRTISHFP
jgi:hypothetical protein